MGGASSWPGGRVTQPESPGGEAAGADSGRTPADRQPVSDTGHAAAGPGYAPRRTRSWIVRRGWVLWAVVVLVAAVVPARWVLGLTPGEGGSWEESLGHYLEFGVFAALVTVSWGQRHRWTGALALGVAAGLGYGLLIEALQYPLPYRSAQAGDFVLDACGVATAALLLTLARPGRERRRGRRG